MLFMAERWATSLIFKAIDESYYMGIDSLQVPPPADMRLAKDRARELAKEGMKKRPFVLPDDKQKVLQEIYNRALKQFS